MIHMVTPLCKYIGLLISVKTKDFKVVDKYSTREHFFAYVAA